MRQFKDAYYSQTSIAAANKLIENLYHDAQVWDQLPAYLKHGRLVYFGLLRGILAGLKVRAERGELTRKQFAEYRLLQRKEKDALGLIELLKRRDAEPNKKEKEETGWRKRRRRQ